MAVILPPFLSTIPPHKRRRRTATSVLAGDFDPRPPRDVLTSLLNGVHRSPSSPTPILRSAPFTTSSQNSPDFSGSLSRTSENSSPLPPPSPTLFAESCSPVHWANSTVLHENKTDGHHGSLYLAPPPHSRRRKGSVGPASSIGFGKRSDNDRSADVSKAASGHVEASLDAGSNTGLRDSSSVTSSVSSFLRRTIHRIRRPSGKSDTGSDTTRNCGQIRNNADVRRKGTQLAARLDLNQDADFVFFQNESTVLDMEELEGRLDAAKNLYREVVDLQMFYKSGTVATMQDLRETGKAVLCCLQNQNAESFEFQYFHGHFHRTMPYSATWIFCWPRFDAFTRN